MILVMHAPRTALAPRILLVEDEFLIRMMVAEQLREAGFEVIEASNGDDAVGILKSGTSFDLVFTDVRMPGAVDGMELLALIKRSRPTVPVVLTSGHLSADLALSAGADQFLPKPSTPGQVVAALKATLEATP